MIPTPHGPKRPFDVAEAFPKLREAVKPYPKAAMFELFESGHTTVFEQLVACIISIRTLDEVSLPTAKRLFEVARTPADIARLPESQIDALIRPSTFHGAKAKTIRDIAQIAVTEHNGHLPPDLATLLSLKGVGPKCAALALGVAVNDPHLAVDIHVHRVTNRWGYIAAPTPEKTQVALMEKLPRQYWVELNALLVPFGKHICTGQYPKCSTCPLLDMCQQVGVTTHR